MINRALVLVKQHTPQPARVLARRAIHDVHNTRLRLTVPVAARCEYVNIYHCAVRKTASQWIKAVFSDPIVYRWSGLPTYDPRFHNWSHPNVCPPERIALSLFFSHGRFQQVDKPQRHRAFFVMRDPRDLVVSSYFSTRHSHAPMGDILEVRRELARRSRKDGMLFLIGDLARKGRFRAVRSWADAPPDERVRLVRYEDLTGPGQDEEVAALMRHCGIRIPPADLRALLDKYSFARMTRRRGSGEVSHYRKGAPGDWRNHFDDDIAAEFERVTGDLVGRLGYDRF